MMVMVVTVPLVMLHMVVLASMLLRSVLFDRHRGFRHNGLGAFLLLGFHRLFGRLFFFRCGSFGFWRLGGFVGVGRFCRVWLRSYGSRRLVGVGRVGGFNLTARERRDGYTEKDRKNVFHRTPITV